MAAESWYLKRRTRWDRKRSLPAGPDAQRKLFALACYAKLTLFCSLQLNIHEMCNCRAAFQLFGIFEPNRREEKTKLEIMNSDSRLISSLVTFHLLWRNFHFSPLPRIIWLAWWRVAIYDDLKPFPQSHRQWSRRWTGCAERLIQTFCIVYYPLKMLCTPRSTLCLLLEFAFTRRDWFRNPGISISPPLFFFWPLKIKKKTSAAVDGRSLSSAMQTFQVI